MTFDIIDIPRLLFATIHVENPDIFDQAVDFERALEMRNLGQSQMLRYHPKALDLLFQLRY